MPKKNIIGSFVFRDDGDGCLTSKYMHDSHNSPFTECCKIIEKTNKDDNFCGIYRTVWLEEKDKHQIAELLIEKNSTNNKIYKLFWRELNNPSNQIFEGSAMLFGKLLVGAYWD